MRELAKSLASSLLCGNQPRSGSTCSTYKHAVCVCVARLFASSRIAPSLPCHTNTHCVFVC
jgi:hypothetical protein